MAEGAALEMPCIPKRDTAGSNPALSAKKTVQESGETSINFLGTNQALKLGKQIFRRGGSRQTSRRQCRVQLSLKVPRLAEWQDSR